MEKGHGTNTGRRRKSSGGGRGAGCAIAAALVFNALAANVSAFVPPLSSSVRGELASRASERERERELERDETESTRSIPAVLLLLPCCWACGGRAMVGAPPQVLRVLVDVDVLSEPPCARSRATTTGTRSLTSLSHERRSHPGETSCPANCCYRLACFGRETGNNGSSSSLRLFFASMICMCSRGSVGSRCAGRDGEHDKAVQPLLLCCVALMPQHALQKPNVQNTSASFSSSAKLPSDWWQYCCTSTLC